MGSTKNQQELKNNGAPSGKKPSGSAPTGKMTGQAPTGQQNGGKAPTGTPPNQSTNKNENRLKAKHLVSQENDQTSTRWPGWR